MNALRFDIAAEGGKHMEACVMREADADVAAANKQLRDAYRAEEAAKAAAQVILSPLTSPRLQPV